AGIGFGSYFVIMHQASTTAVIWPMIASRSSGTLSLVIFLLVMKQDWRVAAVKAWPLMALNGILDVAGNMFYILAGQTGRMDVSAVISSLFPGATVLMAWIILKEKINRVQWLGILTALAAIVLLTV
ncbi:MAG: EamA family transporter, partial [Chloroflexota bacterium]